jgi:serine/threonine protein kinase
MREVNFLRARKHKNISPLLASFTAGLEIPTSDTDTTKCFYLISPEAEMDMKKWLAQEPEYLKNWDSIDLHNHIYTAMRGLIAGVAYIHRNIDDRVGYHGDLKPSNILIFYAERTWAWKICDFGTSRLKPIDNTGTRSIETTRYWAPEEFSDNAGYHGEQNHRRSHDVWSLGCMFTVFATVIVHGWGALGLKAFEHSRTDDSGDSAFWKNKGKVHQWIQKLGNEKSEEAFVRLLELIQEMLKPREERIFSWEVAVDLTSIIKNGSSREDIETHLKEVIQRAREVDGRLQHNPLTRARKDKNKGQTFRNILIENGWYDDQTTEQQKRTGMAQRRLMSTIPVLDTVVERKDMLKMIFTLFEETQSVALSGLGGIG